mgnify:CR=1 FL=1
MKKLYYWLLATRPKTLPVTLCPIALGICLAWQDDYTNILISTIIILSALFIQIGTNLANDYFDFIKGADTSERIGPIRMTQAGLLSQKEMLIGFSVAFIIAFLLGFQLMIIGGLPIVIIGILSLLFGFLYTGSPYSLAYLGIADIIAFLFFGPIASAGTYYLLTESFSTTATLLGLSPGFFSMALLAVNNTRDIDEDRLANKKTLAVRFGINTTRFEYIIALFLGTMIPLLIFYKTQMLLSFLFAIPLLFSLLPSKYIFIENRERLNMLLPLTVITEVMVTVISCILIFLSV